MNNISLLVGWDNPVLPSLVTKLVRNQSVVAVQQPPGPSNEPKTASTSKKRTQPSRIAKAPLCTSAHQSAGDVIAAHEVIFKVVRVFLYDISI